LLILLSAEAANTTFTAIDQTNNLLALEARTPTITPFETKNSSKNVFLLLLNFNRNSALFSKRFIWVNFFSSIVKE
jgi:hypothetical protein